MDDKENTVDNVTEDLDTPDYGGKDAVKKTKKRHRFGILKFFVFLLLFIVLVTGVYALFAVFDAVDPVTHIPDNYLAYASVPAAGDFITEVKDLKVIDTLLADEKSANMRGIIRTIRSNDFLESSLFSWLADMRLDIAAYENGDIVLVGNLGVRSMATRPLPLLAPLMSSLRRPVPGMEFVELDGRKFWVYTPAENLRVYIGTHRNLLIASTSYDRFSAAFVQQTGTAVQDTAQRLKQQKEYTLTFLADAETLLSTFRNSAGLIGLLTQSVTFTDHAAVRTRLTDDKIDVHADVHWKSDVPEMNNLIGKVSSVPSVLSKLPQSTAYFSLINAGSPDFLWENLQAFFGQETRDTYQTADKAADFFVGKSIDELLFSWMGEELGMFGLEYARAPIFFTEIKDERACRLVLEHLFASIFIDQDVSAVVGDRRIPRIEFPTWLQGLLKLFGITLPQYFYVIEDGFLYLSTSAEVLSIALGEVYEGKTLVQSDEWKSTSVQFSPESSFMTYYTLDRAVPFFLQGNESVISLLRSYGRGIFSLRFSKGSQLGIDLTAYKTEAHQMSTVSGFPLEAKASIDTEPVYGREGANLFAYWCSDAQLIRVNLLDGTQITTALDDTGWVLLEKTDEHIDAVWAVSQSGTVYKMNAAFESAAGFPVLTGKPVALPPVLSPHGVVLPLSREPAFLLVDNTGVANISEAMHTKLKSVPAAGNYFIAALPRSFMSQLYLFDYTGAFVEQWPIPLEGIAAVPPVMIVDKQRSHEKVIAVTEQGAVRVFDSSGKTLPGFPVFLHAPVRSDPVFSYSRKSVYVVTNTGSLYRMSLTGEIENHLVLDMPIDTGDAEYVLSFVDIDEDGYDEVALSVGGNAVYCFSGDLLPIQGFPVEGTGRLYFSDIDGDDKKEIISHSLDNKFHAYSGVR